jgi:hypothetical protein
MAKGLFEDALDSLEAHELPLARPAGFTRAQAFELIEAIPSNQQVLDACRAAYSKHTDAVDQTTLGSIRTAQSPDLKRNLQALHAYNWDTKIAVPSLVMPIYHHPLMHDTHAAVQQDGSFLTFFLGVQADLDIIIGGEGGVGVGLPFPSNDGTLPIWMAYGGFRIALNIDVGVNINAGIFMEPPSEVAGDFLGIELSAEPVAEGPEISLGIHLSSDLSKIRGFSLGVGVAVSILPITAAVVKGKIHTHPKIK